MNQVSVKIPGKVMLAGEYSVLFGGSALAATVKNQMDIFAETHHEGRCRLDSSLLNQTTEFSVSDEPTGPFELFFSSALSGMRRHNISGASISVRGDLSPEFGFGSSSALRLGTAVALKTLASGHKEDTYWEEAKEAYNLQKKSQSQASGYDIVTQYMGGVTLLTPSQSQSEQAMNWPGRVTIFPSGAVQRLNQIVHVFVGGKGAPTTATIKSTLSWLKEHDLLETLKEASEKLISAFKTVLQDNEEAPTIDPLIRAVSEHRSIFSAAPAFPTALLTALQDIEGFDKEFSFKTTGAGGEDSVLLIAYESKISQAVSVLAQLGWSKIDTPFAHEGLSIACTQSGEES
jgi:mevalonate kinase